MERLGRCSGRGLSSNGAREELSVGVRPYGVERAVADHHDSFPWFRQRTVRASGAGSCDLASRRCHAAVVSARVRVRRTEQEDQARHRRTVDRQRSAGNARQSYRAIRTPSPCRSRGLNLPASDDVTSERSRLMARVKGKDTKPELLVRRALHRLGYRFRLHRGDLPGRPDIVLPRYRTAIFVHGCFWHRHPGCSRASTPKTRVEFWQNKFDANVARDRRNVDSLGEAGWQVLTIWECETRRMEDLAARLKTQLDASGA